MIRTKENITNRLQKILSVTFCLLLTTSVLLAIPLNAEAHPGGTDENGCHYDRNDRRHCH